MLNSGMNLKLPSVIGHRGTRYGSFYENSLAALNFALETANGFETDTVKSADDEIFFIHDTFFTGSDTYYELRQRLDEPSKLLAGEKRIEQMPAELIRELRLIDGTPIPCLADIIRMMKIHPMALFNLELKGENTALSLLKALSQYEFIESSCILTSFNHPDLLKARESNTSLPLGALYEPSNTQPCPMYTWSDNKALYTPFSLADIKSPLMRDIQPDYFSINEYDLRPEILLAIKDIYPQARVLVWWWYKEPEPKENKRLLHTLEQLDREKLGDTLAAIISDYPADMTKTLKEFGTSHAS